MPRPRPLSATNMLFRHEGRFLPSSQLEGRAGHERRELSAGRASGTPPRLDDQTTRLKVCPAFHSGEPHSWRAPWLCCHKVVRELDKSKYSRQLSVSLQQQQHSISTQASTQRKQEVPRTTPPKITNMSEGNPVYGVGGTAKDGGLSTADTVKDGGPSEQEADASYAGDDGKKYEGCVYT